MKLNIYKNKQEVAEKFSEFLIQRINETEKEFNVSLSGGSTPKVVFDYLSEHYKELDWSKVNFFWGDERCVAPTDSESNYKMTVDHLLKNINLPTENIFRIKGEKNPEEEAKEYSKVLNKKLPIKNDIPTFDLVILGMGDDGHTASIFQDNIHLWNSENNCEVADHPVSGQKRITITGKVINNAKEVVFLVTGEDKKEKVALILKGDDTSRTYPAGLVKPLSGDLYWFLDHSAAETTNTSS